MNLTHHLIFGEIKHGCMRCSVVCSLLDYRVSMIAFFFRLEQIGAAAAKEYSLEKNLQKMKFEWKDICFEFVPYRDSVSYCLGFTGTQGLFAINEHLSIDIAGIFCVRNKCQDFVYLVKHLIS